MNAPNRNLLYARIVVDELARAGLRAVCIAPGSRSTPLVMAFAEHPDIRVYSHIDERSAAFFALGLALASDKPAAVVCSSGTATANFFPAVIEAHYAHVPLLVLTADRPHELRDSGANQTVDQVKLYGDHVLWAVDMPLPEAAPNPLAIRALRTTANRAFAIADGMPKGPVHLNFPFRKPLEPTVVPDDQVEVADGRPERRPHTIISRGLLMATYEQIDHLVRAVRDRRRGVIVCGPRSPRGDFPLVVRRLAAASGFPILADAQSNVRFQGHSDSDQVVITGGHDWYVDRMPSPELIIHFGALPTSAALDAYLSKADAYRIMISGDGTWTDANHQIDVFIHAEPITLCLSASNWLAQDPPQPEQNWLHRWRQVESAAWQALDAALEDEFFDGAAVRAALAALPDESYLFVANSLPIRHVEAYARPDGRGLRVLCNRGASGIDGTISSALGAAAHARQIDRPLALLSGDLAFYHDLNGLLAVRRLGIGAVLIVLNNNGGGIFRRLPVAEFDPPFTELFLTPHDLDFAHAAAMYGIAYTLADNAAAVQEAISAAMRDRRTAIVEIKTDGAHDDSRHQAVLAAVRARIEALLHWETETTEEQERMSER